MISYDNVHLIAATEVRRKHIQLNVDLTKQIDIFRIINENKIPLCFQPLKNLSGAFFPAIPSEYSAAGILINENHPKSRQRYTAAHEFCHYIRDNEIIFDLETEIITRDDFDKCIDRERIAEAFAAWFLMPKELVEYQSNIMNINLARINPTEVYQLSLALGTSYSAMVNHLYSLHKVKWSTRNRLLQVLPKDIKNSISDRSEGMGWNDVWIMNESYNRETVFVQKGDEIQLLLSESPSTGYIWCFDSEECTNIKLSSSYFGTIEQSKLGTPGKRKIIINAIEEGMCDITLTHKRPWIKNKNDEDKFILLTYVEGRRHGINIQYLN